MKDLRLPTFFCGSLEQIYALARQEVDHPSRSVYLFPSEFSFLLHAPEAQALDFDVPYGRSFVSRASAAGYVFETVTAAPSFTAARRLQDVGL